jgi:hypothetical protein
VEIDDGVDLSRPPHSLPAEVVVLGSILKSGLGLATSCHS